MVQLIRQGVNHSNIDYAKFEQVVKYGATKEQVTSDLGKKYVTGQNIRTNIGSLSKEQAITLVKLIGASNLTREETHQLKDVIKPTCKSGHCNWYNYSGTQTCDVSRSGKCVKAYMYAYCTTCNSDGTTGSRYFCSECLFHNL